MKELAEMEYDEAKEKTAEIAEELKSLGYYIPAIRPPTVPENSSRLRISLTADTKLDDFRKIIDTITSRIR